jgi:hypothetical protein
VKKSVKRDKRKWMDGQAERAEKAALRGDAEVLHGFTRMF